VNSNTFMTRSTITSSAKLWIICAVYSALTFASHGSDYMAFVTLKGEKQGEIWGELDSKGKKITEILALNHEVTSPRDSQTGLPTGKRIHKPIHAVIRAGRATPFLFSALVNNERLAAVELSLQRPTKLGVLKEYMRIKLTDAFVANMTTWQPTKVDPVNTPHTVAHIVSLIYEKIEWTYIDGGITAFDDWDANN
jgi:type VI secretion system secreted protein Hcp